MRRKIKAFSVLSILHTANEKLWQRTSPESNVNNYGEGISFDGNFSALLSDFYRLEYIYSSLKDRPFSGNERRRENILNQVEDVFSDVCSELKELFVAVFQDWLSKHAITNPREWAEQRVNDSEGGGNGALGGLFDEYLRYYDGSGKSPNQNYYQKINYDKYAAAMFAEVAEHPEGVELFWDILGGKEANIEDAVNMEMDNFDSDPEDTLSAYGLGEETSREEFEEEVRKRKEEEFSLPSSVQDYIENYGYEDGFLYRYESSNPDLQIDFAILVGQYAVFPKWYAYWSPQGIDETRAQVEKVYNLLQENGNLGEQYAAINLAINTSHQTGAMLDYVADVANESSSALKKLLEDLTAGDFTSEIDPILRESGVQI